MKIAVAGAGIAGLASAALLARAGHDVTILDRFDAPAPVGSGLMIQPVGHAVLDDLGLADALRARASEVNRIMGQTHAGRTVLDVHYGDWRADLCGYGVQRSALFDLLLEAAREAGVLLRTSQTIVRAQQDHLGAVLHMLEGASERFDLVLDCLGASSVLCPRPTAPLSFGALWALLDWPEDGPFQADCLEQRYLNASRMVGVLPVGRTDGGRSKLTFFWSLRADGLETWREQPLVHWKDQVRALWPETATLLDQITSHDDLIFAQYTHRTLRRPGRGRIVHLGDSFHATSPQLGQGANMALLDAAAFAEAVSVSESPGAAGALFGRMRRRHVWLYQSASWLFTPLYQSDSRALAWMRDRVAAPLSRVRPIPRVLAQLVAGGLGHAVSGNRPQGAP